MPEVELFKRCFSVAQKIDVQPLIEQGFQGQEIAVELRKQRINAITQVREKADYS